MEGLPKVRRSRFFSKAVATMFGRLFVPGRLESFPLVWPGAVTVAADEALDAMATPTSAPFASVAEVLAALRGFLGTSVASTRSGFRPGAGGEGFSTTGTVNKEWSVISVPMAWRVMHGFDALGLVLFFTLALLYDQLMSISTSSNDSGEPIAAGLSFLGVFPSVMTQISDPPRLTQYTVQQPSLPGQKAGKRMPSHGLPLSLAA